MADHQFHPETYGDQIADIYDEIHSHLDDQEAAAAFLAELAGAGPALELGIGTGRVALPLARRGVEVHGVDASDAMIAQLLAKPGGTAITVTRTDMADLGPVPGDYTVVYAVFNTFFALLTQDDQVRCFAQVAERLRPAGRFVIQAMVPDPDILRHRTDTTTIDAGTRHAFLAATTRDALAQTITSTHVLITEHGIRLFPIRLRYAWPTELDLMARLAGMELEGRWADWDRRVLSPKGRHVSVYRKTG